MVAKWNRPGSSPVTVLCRTGSRSDIDNHLNRFVGTSPRTGLVTAVLRVLLGGAGAAPRLAAQRDTIRWWDGAAALGGIAFASAFDEAVQHATQQGRTRSGDQVAAVARRMGQPEVFATVPAAVFLAGVVARARPGPRHRQRGRELRRTTEPIGRHLR